MAEDKNQKSGGAAVVGEIKSSDEVLSFKRKPKTSSANTSTITEIKKIDTTLVSEGETTSAKEVIIINKDAHVHTTPRGRALANKLGVELSKIRGTGPDGRILLSDIRLAAKSGAATPPPPPYTTIVPPSEPVVSNVESEKVEEFTPTPSPTPEPPKPMMSSGFPISPTARAMAQKHNVDISSIKPEHARILVSDVERVVGVATSKPPTPPPTPSLPPKPAPISIAMNQEDREVKITPMRRAIAKSMRSSWSSVAYTNLVVEVDVTALWDYRASVKNKILELTNTKLTFLPFIIKAVGLALREFPEMNAAYDEKNDKLIFKGDINMSIAIDTKEGLIVPTIRHSDRKNLVQLAQDVTKLAIKARDRKLAGPDLKDGTFTITNYGSVGALYGVPVIYYPQIAIAGVGAIVDRVYWKDGEAKPGKVMHLTVAADHRWVDGANVGRFASKVKMYLENPAILSIL